MFDWARDDVGTHTVQTRDSNSTAQMEQAIDATDSFLRGQSEADC
jgi:hypothetical protein